MPLLAPNTGRISAPIPIRTKHHVLVDYPDMDATVSNVFRVYGYSDTQTICQNFMAYMPLVILDHIYHSLKSYKLYFFPKDAPRRKGRKKPSRTSQQKMELMYLNQVLGMFHTYFSVLLSDKSDDVYRLLDDMDEMQCRFTLQYTFLTYDLQNNNFRRRTFTDEQIRKYGYLITALAEFTHLAALAESVGLIIDNGTRQMFNMVDGPLFQSVFPEYKGMVEEDSSLCNRTIITVNNIISARLDELKAEQEQNQLKP